MSDLSNSQPTETHTLTQTAMHIDCDRVYAFAYHLLKTGVYVMQTHYVMRVPDQLYCAMGLCLKLAL